MCKDIQRASNSDDSYNEIRIICTLLCAVWWQEVGKINWKNTSGLLSHISLVFNSATYLVGLLESYGMLTCIHFSVTE